MLKIGDYNKLKVLKKSEFGFFLVDDEDTEILLPRKLVPPDLKFNDEIEVFVCYDSEDRLVATTEVPLVKVGEFATLKVVAIEEIGAFLNWGLSKDLFLPHSEQTRDIRAGNDVTVFVYLDKSQRISASMRLERHLEKTPDKSEAVYKEGQKVDLLIIGKTDLGFKAVINGKHLGMLYANEVFRPLYQGQRMDGFIKSQRDDGKIDLSLTEIGLKAADDIAEKILSLLKKRGGFASLTDKTPAEEIYDLFGVSKKKFKIALGGLYKKRLIVVDEKGIRLVVK